MKVYEGKAPPAMVPLQKKGTKGLEDHDFKKIMDETNKKMEGNEKTTVPITPGFPPNGVQIVHSGVEVNQPEQSVKMGEILATIRETLDIIDFYVEKMSDMSFKTTDLEPMVSHLEDQAIYLDEMRSDPGLPKGLEPIISDLSLTIETEVARYRRGDYV